MSEFLAFFQLGFAHIAGVGAVDHVLFLLVLAAVYRPGDWRAALVVISAFTVGHSVTLALAVSDLLPVSAAVIEFLIPVTIVAAALDNIVVRDRTPSPRASYRRPLLAAVFGLVHGAGFAGYLQSLFLTSIAVPLVGFNVGIEVGQILVLLVIGVALVGVDAALRRLRRASSAPSALRLRAVGVSAVVGAVAAGWAVERHPW